nr:PREDICTED: uncharacterized protein LOC107126666 [Macaca fascicularis]
MNDYQLVQDLREVNKQTITVHPTIPHPYTLLSLLPPEHIVYTVLDLKDAFFAIPLAPKSQPIFAFGWTDPSSGDNTQLTWTRLPQGFKNSPTLFGEAFQQDLIPFQASHPNCTLLQYVDNVLLAAGTIDSSLQHTRDLLYLLQELGYRVSAKKAQLCLPRVSYLGYEINQGKRALTSAWKEAILRIPTPTTKRQSLQQAQDIIQPLVRGAHPNPVPDQTGPCHSFQPGDLVFVKKFQREGLTPAWKGPHTVILTMPMALKVDGIPAWIHHSRIKKINKAQQETWIPKPGSGPLKLCLSQDMYSQTLLGGQELPKKSPLQLIYVRCSQNQPVPTESNAICRSWGQEASTLQQDLTLREPDWMWELQRCRKGTPKC